MCHGSNCMAVVITRYRMVLFLSLSVRLPLRGWTRWTCHAAAWRSCLLSCFTARTLPTSTSKTTSCPLTKVFQHSPGQFLSSALLHTLILRAHLLLCLMIRHGEDLVVNILCSFFFCVCVCTRVCMCACVFGYPWVVEAWWFLGVCVWVIKRELQQWWEIWHQLSGLLGRRLLCVFQVRLGDVSCGCHGFMRLSSLSLTFVYLWLFFTLPSPKNIKYNVAKFGKLSCTFLLLYKQAFTKALVLGLETCLVSRRKTFQVINTNWIYFLITF